MSVDLQTAAAETVTQLLSRPGIDGVLVVLARNKDDVMGCSMAAQDVSVDSMIAAVVQLLGQLRARALSDATAARKITTLGN